MPIVSNEFVSADPGLDLVEVDTNQPVGAENVQKSR